MKRMLQKDDLIMADIKPKSRIQTRNILIFVFGLFALGSLIVIGLIPKGKVAKSQNAYESRPLNNYKSEQKLDIVLEDIGYWKKANNRVYTVFAPDTIWIALQKHAISKMPSYGNITYVFFFDDKNMTPDITNLKFIYVGEVVDYIYDLGYIDHCIGQYSRYPTGFSDFTKYPGKD